MTLHPCFQPGSLTPPPPHPLPYISGILSSLVPACFVTPSVPCFGRQSPWMCHCLGHLVCAYPRCWLPIKLEQLQFGRYLEWTEDPRFENVTKDQRFSGTYFWQSLILYRVWTTSTCFLLAACLSGADELCNRVMSFSLTFSPDQAGDLWQAGFFHMANLPVVWSACCRPTQYISPLSHGQSLPSGLAFSLASSVKYGAFTILHLHTFWTIHSGMWPESSTLWMI